jgi:hypothetical protein
MNYELLFLKAASDFWNGKDSWYSTWNAAENNGEDAAMKERIIVHVRNIEKTLLKRPFKKNISLL